MDYKHYYTKNKTYLTYIDRRLKKIVDLVQKYKPKSVLDIGCGDGFLLKEIQKYLPDSKLYGIDVYSTKIDNVEIKIGDVTRGLPHEDNQFELVILGEVIEHVPDPDFVLREIRRVLKKGGIVIITTPNLVSWANRVMVLLGIQPFFTETSTEKNLGRYFKILGQEEKVQGHLKIFTHKSLEEILNKEGFRIKEKFGTTFFFPWPISLIDLLFTNFISLSSGLIYVSKNNKYNLRK